MDAQIQTLGWAAVVWLAGLLAIVLARRAEQGRWLARLDGSSLGVTLREVALFLYCVATPGVLLIAGIVGRDSLGLQDGQTAAEWLRGAGLAASVAAAAAVTLRVGARSIGALLPGVSWTALRDAIYLETMWALFRAASTSLLGDPYGGAIVGMAPGLVFLAALGRFSPPRAPAGIGQLGVDLACLLASALMFFATRNLALCIAAHAVIRLGAGSAAPRSGL